MVLPLNAYDDPEDICTHSDTHCPCVGCKYRLDDIDCLKEFGCGLKIKRGKIK